MYAILLRLWGRLFHRMNYFSCMRVEDLPNDLAPGMVYIAGENDHVWYAAFLCPCGCKATIQLGLMEGHRPRWKVIEHVDGTVSLHPSVWRRVGCKSHFFLKKGKVKWVG